jgi:hypothetical protein
MAEHVLRQTSRFAKRPPCFESTSDQLLQLVAIVCAADHAAGDAEPAVQILPDTKGNRSLNLLPVKTPGFIEIANRGHPIGADSHACSKWSWPSESCASRRIGIRKEHSIIPDYSPHIPMIPKFSVSLTVSQVAKTLGTNGKQLRHFDWPSPRLFRRERECRPNYFRSFLSSRPGNRLILARVRHILGMRSTEWPVGIRLY